MSTNTTITFSLPPAMANQVKELLAQQGRSCSELVQQALDRYIKDVEWERITRDTRGTWAVSRTGGHDAGGSCLRMPGRSTIIKPDADSASAPRNRAGKP